MLITSSTPVVVIKAGVMLGIVIKALADSPAIIHGGNGFVFQFPAGHLAG